MVIHELGEMMGNELSTDTTPLFVMAGAAPVLGVRSRISESWYPLALLAMKIDPAPEIAIEMGVSSAAAPAGPPSPLLPTPWFPAMVLMIPPAVTSRITSLPVSAKN